MKKIRWILGLLLLLLVACQEHFSEDSRENLSGTVTFEMGYRMAEESVLSRSFVDQPGPKFYPPLWVVVFDGAGYLVEYAKASNFHHNGDEVFFKVTLRTTSNKRIVHFLLGYADNLNLKFGHESAVIGSLMVSGRQGAYWQRCVLADGLSAATVEAHLQRVPLLRNFAKISVTNLDTEQFDLLGFYVLNVPDRGSVAPYMEGRFVDYVSEKGEQAKDYATLVDDEGYVGVMPPGTNFIHAPGGEDEGLTWTPDGGAFFLYEHTHTGDPNTTLSVILKGCYRGGAETYYKVDLVKQEAERAVYYHILRNFEYAVRIKEVVGNGEPSFDAACFGLSGNNLSSSIVVKKVLNVSDGTAALRVAYTDTTLVTSDPVTLRYRYVPDLSRPETTANEKIQAKWLDGADGVLFSLQVDQQASADGWGTFTLTPLVMPSYPKTQSLLVFCSENRLSREVVFELRPLLEGELVCSPKNLLGVKGEPVTVDLLLPHEMGEAIFPLDFIIEAQEKDNTSYPANPLSPRSDEVMSVRSGLSLVSGFEKRQSIQYVKTVSYADYQALPKAADGIRHRLTCHFVTNTRESASRIYVHNKYFKTVSDTFGY